MKKNVFTKSIRILIITLLILAVLVPREYSQKGMAIALILWLAFSLVQFLWCNKDRWKIKNPFSNLVTRYCDTGKENEIPPYPSHPTELEVPSKPQKPASTLTEIETENVLLQFSLRITEKLKSAYPKAVWQWKDKPSLHELLAGTTVRIIVENMDKFTHADITFDRFGRIHVEPMSIGNFSPDAEADETVTEEIPSEPAVVDVRAWYELIGQRILETQITELNANGHSKLTIKENGDIVINRQKKEVFVTSLEAFPEKNYWDELVTVLQESELTAKIAGNALQVSWI